MEEERRVRFKDTDEFLDFIGSEEEATRDPDGIMVDSGNLAAFTADEFDDDSDSSFSPPAFGIPAPSRATPQTPRKVAAPSPKARKPVQRKGNYSASRKPSGQAGGSGVKSKLILGGSAAAVVLAGWGATSVLSGGGGSTPTATAVSPSASSSAMKVIPVSVPNGLSRSYTWSAVTDQSSSPVVLPNGYVVTKNGAQFGIYDADSNRKLYSSTNVSQPVSSAPFGSGAASGFAWNNGNGTGSIWTSTTGAKSFSIPTKGSLYMTGGQPFVWSSETPLESSIIASNGSSQSVKLTKGYTPMGTLDGNKVVSSNGDKTLHIEDSKKKQTVVNLDLPSGKIVRKWYGMVGNTMIVALDKKGNPDNNRAVTVAFYDVNSGKIKAKSDTKWQTVASAISTTSQDFKKIGLGPVFYDGASTAKTASDQSVTTISISGDHVYAIDPQQNMGEVQGGEFTPFSSQTGIPVGTTEKGNSIMRVGGSVYSVPAA